MGPGEVRRAAPAAWRGWWRVKWVMVSSVKGSPLRTVSSVPGIEVGLVAGGLEDADGDHLVQAAGVGDLGEVAPVQEERDVVGGAVLEDGGAARSAMAAA
jgi:hypothetical protein